VQEVGYYASWATFFVGPFALLWGILLFVLARALGWLAIPRWLVRTITAVFAFFLSLLGLAAAGWYIAIAGVVVYGGAAVGSLLGGWILPRFTGTTGPIRKPWLRWASATVVVLGSFGLVIYPVLPDRNARSLKVVMERLVPGPDEIGPDSGLTKNEVAVLNSLGLKRKLHGGIQSYSGSGEKSARALIVIRGPLTSKVTLRQPKATNVA
jgi:MFS family permease